jgi:pyruvate/2-oxoglutarate dehydrogenase complex dihydrolipoamide dehydrogenase (E3) component
MLEVRRVVSRVAQAEGPNVLAGEGIDFVEGRATFAGPRVVHVAARTLTSRRFVVAAGASALVPAITGLSGARPLTNENVFELVDQPRRLIVLGGGPIGVEMAEAFARLGTSVTLVEAEPRLLPREEPEASEAITAYLGGLGVMVRAGTTCTSVSSGTGVTRLCLDGVAKIEADRVLVAVGRRPASDGLGLDAAGVETDARGFITVDAALRTSARGVFAAGDVAQPLQFTHVADETGRFAARNALSSGPKRRFHPEWVPAVTFTGLEVARVGRTEAEASRVKGARVAYLPMSEVDRALTAGEVSGFVKLVTVPRRLTGSLAGGAIAGATIVAPRAGEMLAEVVLAMRAGVFPARLATTTHAYPTWGLAVQQAAAQLFGEYGGRAALPAKRGIVSPVTTFQG